MIKANETRVIDIDRTTAEAALRAAAFTDEDGRTTVHSFVGAIGADHDLDHALAQVAKADRIAWVSHLLAHDLAVQVGDRVIRYDVKQPENAGERRDDRVDALTAAQRVIDRYGAVTVEKVAEMPNRNIAEVVLALAALRPDATAGIVHQQQHTGPVGALPIRSVTDHDARVLATTVRAHLELVDTLQDTLGTSGFDADVRDRLERLLLELDG